MPYTRGIRAAALLFLLLLVSSHATADELTVPIPNLPVQVQRAPHGGALFIGSDIQYLSQTGEPAIPFMTFRVLLPPATQVPTVTADVQQARIEQVPGLWDVLPAPPAATWRLGVREVVWPSGRTFVNGRDSGVYTADAVFPSALLHSVMPGQFRDWKLADVTVALAQYNPVTGVLHRLVEGTVSLRFSVAAPPQQFTGEYADAANAAHARKLVVNFDQVAPQYRTSKPKEFLGHKAAFLIVTTQQIEKDSQALKKFVQSKRKRGFNVNVVTEETWGGGRGDIAADNLRGWLRSKYLAAKLVLDRRDLSWDDVPKYVLLIGNPDPYAGDVPMKMLWPRPDAPYWRESPSDFYYSDLTGNWDRDGDGLSGEYWGDFGAGGIDRYPELLVGRIPFYGSIADLDRILDKIVLYENASPADVSWRRNVLLPMKPSDEVTPGYHLGEEIKDTVLIPQGWGYHRIYDESYGLNPPPETVPVTVQNVTRIWTSAPFGATFWWTHGWSEGASDIMDLSHAALLNDTYPAFTFQASCDNSFPEDAFNLTYSLLKNGGLNTISATRVSWYWVGQRSFADYDSNSGFTFGYARRLIRDGMDSGAALFDLKATLYPTCSEMWMNYTGFNIYGDPSLGLSTAEGK
ncbi:MAG TPA: C25 family cysteine peptidase [Bryobacteraceae bacterium]|nr:C25 family cysteine peptidase [Bryobacteraceae bacterium]